MIRAVCIGECMVELRPVGDGLYARGFAGDSFNTAVYLRRALNAESPAAEVAYLTTVGDDALSAAVRAEFDHHGLSDARVSTAPGLSPGLYIIELDAAGDRSFHYWRSASAARLWWRDLQRAGGADALAGVDLVYLSGISLAILSPEDWAGALAAFAALRGRVGLTAFDPNLRLRLWPDLPTARTAIEAAAGAADVVLPSQQDGELLWNELDPCVQLARWRALGAAEVALTLAAEGARLSWGREQASVPAPAPRAVVDTSGAGDSFNGAYLAARLQGAPPPRAAQAGAALAAHVIAHPGAIAPPG